MIEGYNRGVYPRYNNQSMSTLSYDQTPQHKYMLCAHASLPAVHSGQQEITNESRARQRKINLVFASAERQLSTESFYHRREDAMGSSPLTNMEKFW